MRRKYMEESRRKGQMLSCSEEDFSNTEGSDDDLRELFRQVHRWINDVRRNAFPGHKCALRW